MIKKLTATAVFSILAAGILPAAPMEAMSKDAQVVMTSLSARQRFPWNGKVDIDFSFTSAVPDAFAFIHFEASYVDGEGMCVKVPMNTFDQMSLPWCTTAGTYRVTWNSTADVPDLTVTNIRYKVTANMAKYMVVDLSSGKNGDKWPVSYYEDVPDFPGVEKGKWDDYHKTTNLVLRLIQPGEYIQAWDDASNNGNKQVMSHTAIITKPFYLAVFELTQEQHYLMNGSHGQSQFIFTGGRRKMRPTVETYRIVRGSGLASLDGVNWPVTGSKVGDSSLLKILRDKTGASGFDLPTESEWEYACRSGGTASGFWNDGSDAGISRETKYSTIENGNENIERLGRYQHNGGMVKTVNGEGVVSYNNADSTSGEELGTAVVGSYVSNSWGLYDMHGNVAEWCLDYRFTGSDPWYAWTKNSVHTNDLGAALQEWKSGAQRIHRGGKWSSKASECAISLRGFDNETQANGVRLCWRFETPAQTQAE